MAEFLWYIPNQVEPGHRGDDATRGHNSLDRLTELATLTEQHGWSGALLGTGEAKVATMAENVGDRDHRWFKAVGQQRLVDLAARGDVLDDNLYTAPGKYGGGGAGTTWLVGSAEDVAKSLKKYQDLGITTFILSDTPYREETIRIGDQLLPLLR